MRLPNFSAEQSVYVPVAVYSSRAAGFHSSYRKNVMPQQLTAIGSQNLGLTIGSAHPLCDFQHWLCIRRIPACTSQCVNSGLPQCISASNPQACEAMVWMQCSGTCTVACDSAYTDCLRRHGHL
jgi:hypothetical protein